MTSLAVMRDTMRSSSVHGSNHRSKVLRDCFQPHVLSTEVDRGQRSLLDGAMSEEQLVKRSGKDGLRGSAEHG